MENLYNEVYGEAQKRELPPLYKEKVLQWLQPQLEDKTLELGIGSGDMLEWLKQYTPGAIGSDINQEFLIKLQKQNTVATDAMALPFANNSFTKSVSMHTIEHIPDLARVFQELDRVTKDGGISLHGFPAPSEHAIRGADGSFYDAWNMTHNPIKAFLLARKFHPHNLNPRKLESFLQGTQWKIKESQRIYVPEEKGWSWVVLLQK